jgi:hypothetical protein
MSALATPGVPLLWADIPTVDHMKGIARITPQEPYQWVVDPGKPFAVTVAADAKSGADRCVLTVWNWSRTPVAQAALGVPCEEPFTFAVEGRGTYLLTLDLFAGDKCIARLPRSFSVCPSNAAKRATFGGDQFFIGTCSYPDRQHWTNDYGPAFPPGLTEQQSREIEAGLTARLGMQVVRVGPLGYWFDEVKPMDFDRADACVNTLAARGLKLDLQIGNGFDWMIKDRYRDVKDPKWRYPPREEPIRKYTHAVVERYAKYAKFIEVNNEPDNKDFWRGTPEEFVEYTRAVIDEIRKTAPGVPIANGGLCFIEPMWTGIIVKGIRGLTDLQAYHSHGDCAAITAAFGTMQAVHAAAGYDKPQFVNTEMGYAAWRLDVEREMAATAAQKVLYCWAHGHRGALLYCSRDIGGPRGGDWGYLDYTFCPRFMYGAIAAIVDNYAGARFSRVITESPRLHAYEFTAEGKRLVALFAPDNNERSVTLETDAAAATLLDPMGNPTTIVDPKRITVTAQYYPQTLVLDRATQVTVKEGAG